MWLFQISAVFFIAAVISVEATQTESDELSKGISQFAFDFYEQCEKSKPGNVFVSPLSVASSLALLSQASSGKTFEELRNGLHLSDNKEHIASLFQQYNKGLSGKTKDPSISIINQIYVKSGAQLNKDFEKVATSTFEAGVESMDFTDTTKCAEIINNFVEDKTNKKVTNFVKPSMLSADTDVFLVNAIYFKGIWQKKFDAEETSEGEFYINESETVPAVFMGVDDVFSHATLPELDASALEMKYENSKFSFVAILPTSRTGLPTLETKLKEYNFTNITNQLNPHIVSVIIPKFKIEYEIELNDVLKAMNMGEIFSDHAELTGLLANNESLKVSKAIHKAVIEVNEEGSEAAAATGDAIHTRMMIPTFYANHPFMYFIRDTESNTIVFSGRIETTNKD